MNTHEEYVTYAQAKALKELGFDWPCRTSYYTSKAFPSDKGRFVRSLQSDSNSELPGHWCSAPTQEVACRWLREEKGVILSAMFGHYSENWLWETSKTNGVIGQVSSETYSSYEAALSAGIDRAIQLLKGGEG